MAKAMWSAAALTGVVLVGGSVFVLQESRALTGSAIERQASMSAELRAALAERDAARAEISQTVGQRDVLNAQARTLTDMLVETAGQRDQFVEKVQGLNAQLAEVVQTRDAFIERTQALIRTLEIHRLPTEASIAEAGYSYAGFNNPFLDRRDEFRALKTGAADADALWSALRPIAESFTGTGDPLRDRITGAMLVVGAFYDYGNPPPDDTKVGCASMNAETGFVSLGAPTFERLAGADVGCCTDFAFMLSSFLDHLDIENQIVSSNSHQAVRVGDDFVDSNTLIYARDFFGDGQRSLAYYTSYLDSRTARFQHYLMNSIMLAEEGNRPGDFRQRAMLEEASLWTGR